MFYLTTLFLGVLWWIFYTERKPILFLTFFGANVRLSYLFTQFLFLKRKVNQDFQFFLIDPNVRVYCYRISFFAAFFSFSCFHFLLFGLTRRGGFLLVEESRHLCLFSIRSVFRLMWAYAFVDRDLSKTFSFEIGTINHTGIHEIVANPPNGHSPRNGIPNWEFSFYFFNFFGVIFDVYVSRVTFLARFWHYFFSMQTKKAERYLPVFFRVCVRIISVYIFSGEYLLFDTSLKLLLLVCIELFIFFRILIWNISRHKQLIGVLNETIFGHQLCLTKTTDSRRKMRIYFLVF